MADRLVVDASVAAKWFLNDECDGVGQAENILARSLAAELELYAPRVFQYEVCSLLAKACGSWTGPDKGRHRRLSRPDGLEAITMFVDVKIHFEEITPSAASRILEMCIDYSKTFKDMSYLHLAEKLDCRFCTADRKVREGAPPTFPAGRVLLLSEWAFS